MDLGVDEHGNLVNNDGKKDLPPPEGAALPEPGTVGVGDLLDVLADSLGPGDSIRAGGSSRRHHLVNTADTILRRAKELHWPMCTIGGVVYLYTKGRWSEVKKEELQRFLDRCAERLGVDISLAHHYAFSRDLVKQLLSRADLPPPKRNEEAVLVNLANGTYVFDPDGPYLRPHEPADFLRYQLSYPFDPNAEAPLFRVFLNRVLPDETLQMQLFEFLASAFIPP